MPTPDKLGKSYDGSPVEFSVENGMPHWEGSSGWNKASMDSRSLSGIIGNFREGGDLRDPTEKVAAGELEWNQAMAEASSNSWKDEWLTILVSIPLILAFTGHEDIVMKGFAALEQMPDFYKTAVGVVFAASFGIQSIKNMMKRK